ncbi:MAG: ribosome biogenesis GTP-binding protein YihA/YsxC [Muribaculaceae bacterium]|jgi:ribosome biogenesis GTP-binding protein YsxC/EngB|nr:ribosome biogenesis GTP-binding protein YihA/YsxC [Muribaculaceae bacterium]
MIVNTAQFITSSPDLKKCPEGTDRHEYAFIGRSNVGKSSLINMLTGRKDLAKTSSKPGKTAQINYFLVNDNWYLVDLPGYGYAERSKNDRVAFEKMIRGYILGREQMTNLFLLIDGRHKPQKNDLEFMQWLGENGVPFSIVFTKLDKLSSLAAKKTVEVYLDALREQWEELPPVFRTSSVDGRGKSEILDYIEGMNMLPLGEDDIEG